MKLRSLIQPKKKSGVGILFFFLILFVVLILGFMGAMIWSVLDIANDAIYPALQGLGVVEGVNANVTEYVDYGFGVTNTFVASMPWIIAFGYVLTLIFTLVFIYVAGYTPHPAFMAFYVSLMLLIIFGCVIMSNIYENIYQSGTEVSTRLKEQSIMSHLILHSPFIMTMIALVGGILMFARQSNAEGVTPGGFSGI